MRIPSHEKVMVILLLVHEHFVEGTIPNICNCVNKEMCVLKPCPIAANVYSLLCFVKHMAERLHFCNHLVAGLQVNALMRYLK